MNKIILALDTTNLEEAINITQKIKHKIFSVKIGLELWNSFGKNGVKKYGSKDSGGVLGEILGPLIKKKNKK